MQNLLKSNSIFRQWSFLALLSFLINSEVAYTQCAGLVDAGPDLFTCDPSMMVQLQGKINGNPNKFEWTPIAGLSDPKALDPMVTTKTPGKYKYTLSAEVIGTNNLILNGNFEAGYSGFSTEYVFKTLGQGFGPDNVAIATNPQAYNSGFQTCGDHTSGSGNMLLVDGSTQSGKKVWCQTVPTTPGQMYQFELYSMLVFPVAPSVLSITVNGSSIGGGIAGALCDWTLMTACFTATSSSSTICVSEQTGVGYGNDFALDDIALYEKCTDDDEVEIEIVDLKAVVTIPLKPKCSSEIFDLFGTGSSSGPNVSYQWATDRGEIVSQNGLIAKARGSGTYTLKVIYKNGNTLCEKEASIDYEAPEKLDGLIRSQGLANCALDTINLLINMNTGSGDYTYEWSPNLDVLNGNKSDLAKVIKAQTYKVTITDVNTGCKLELEKSVNADTILPVFNLSGDTLINCVKKNIILVSSQQDTTLYSIRWILPDNNIVNDATTLQSGIQGIYTLQITNKLNKCSSSKNILVSIDTTFPITSAPDSLTINCLNNNAVISPQGINSKDLKYYWSLSDGSFFIDDSIKSRTILKPGVVVIRTVNSLNGCEDIDSIFIQDNRSFPNLSITAAQELNCIRKTVDLNANTSSTKNISILWYTNNGNVSGSQQNLNTSADKKGIYYIRLRDTISYCEVIDSIEVFENINLPTVILGQDLVFQCKDSLLTIDASQSSMGATYQYLWSTSNGNITNGNGTQKIDIIQPGIYKLIITDTKNGCKDSATIKVSPDANKPILNLAPASKLTCKINSLNLEAIANSQTGNSLIYQWRGDKNQMIQNPATARPTVLEPGNYTVIVTDAGNGCSSSAILNIIIDTIPPQANAGPDQILNCAIKELTLIGNSGSGTNLSNIWSTSNGTIINTADPSSIKTTTPGIYIFSTTNNDNGCSSSDQLLITIDTSKPLINIAQPDTLTCAKQQILLNSTGSSAGQGYTYQWQTQNGNIIDPVTSPIIKIDKKGRYILVITNSVNQCFNSKTVDVLEDIIPPSLSIKTPSTLSCRIKSVNLDLTLTNTKNPTILWSTSSGSIIKDADRLNPEINKEAWYYVRVSSENGCVSLDSVYVSEIKNIPINLTTDIIQPFCPDDEASLNQILVQGGEQPYEYFIDGQKLIKFPVSNLSPGPHSIKVIDKNGCELLSNFLINTPTAIDVDLPADLKIDQGTNLSLQFITSTPLDSIENIEWQPAEKLTCNTCPNPSTQNLEDENIFTVTITNKNGCTATATIRISIIKRGFWMPNSFSPNGDGINDIFHPVGNEDAIKEIKTFQIYDRWGALMYRQDNIPNTSLNMGWNGFFRDQPVNPGVYSYWLNIVWNNGETQTLIGDVSLLR